MIKIYCWRISKLSKNELNDILDIFYDYFNVIIGSFCFSEMHLTLNFYLV